MRHISLLILVVILLSEAACAPAVSPTAALTSTAAPAPVSTATASAAPQPTATASPTISITPSAEYFTGLWICCTGYELHRSDGGYRFEHSLRPLVSRDVYGKIALDGGVMTYVEQSSDCTPDQIGRYDVHISDANTYELKMISDPCTWRAKTGSAPLDGAVFHRSKPTVGLGTWVKTITPEDVAAVGNSAAGLAGKWELQLQEDFQYELRHDGQVVDGSRYVDAEKQFILNAPKLCANHGEALGTFKVQVKGNDVSFFRQEADCEPLVFVLRTNPWMRK